MGFFISFVSRNFRYKSIVKMRSLETMATTTPLRYPGGKSVMTDFIKNFILTNKMEDVCYAEPFAGGAGAALNLLTDNIVDNIIINDASIPIFSFWKSLVEYSEEFLYLFDKTPINLNEWLKQKDIFENKCSEFSVEMGFATFYLNRCNRSGILKAGPIGGNTEEKQKLAKYKIDARFNKTNLRPKLEVIIKLKNKITVSNLDAIEFITQCQKLSIKDRRKLLIYLDPPYYIHGSELYMNFYIHKDHLALAKLLSKSTVFKWILSYDNVEEIQKLYKRFDLYTFDLTYTVQTSKQGKELLTHSKNSVLPSNLIIPRATTDIEIKKIEFGN